MFTGLVEQTGILLERVKVGGRAKITVRAATPWRDLVHGESIAVNGVCLTVEKYSADGAITFHTLEETLKRTNLGLLAPRSKVNLERALKLGDRLGGHIVYGHVDATAKVRELKKLASGDLLLELELPSALGSEVVPRGSVAIDGVSLTVVEATPEHFSVELIPTTLQTTALANRPAGTPVNVETDMLAKYVASRMAAASPAPGGLTLEKLREAGLLE